MKEDISEDVVGGSLSKYANFILIKNENRGWQEHWTEKHKKVVRWCLQPTVNNTRIK